MKKLVYITILTLLAAGGTAFEFSLNNYSINQVDSTKSNLSPGETARFKADVKAPSSQMVQVEWFLRPRGDVVARTQERVFNSESRVSTQISYDELETPPGDYTLAARVVKNADQKAVSRGTKVTLKSDETDFGDDISVSINQAPSETISRGGIYNIEVSVDASSGGLLGQRITLKEENGGYFERSSECDPPESRPTGRVFDCSKNFDYNPETTGNVDLVAEASTSTGARDSDDEQLEVIEEEDTPSGDVTLIVDLEDAEGDDMDGGDYTLEGDGQVRQKNGGSIDTRFIGVDASESYDLSVQCGPETVREDVNPNGGDTERVELILDEASTIDSCNEYPGSDPDPTPEPEPDPGLGEIADITVLEPDSVEENPVPLEISLDRDPDEYSCFWDDDSFDVVDTGNSLSRFEDEFSDSSNFDNGQTVYFQCERTDGERTTREQESFIIQQTVQQPTADLQVTPQTGQEGDTFVFDASGSNQADSFEFDFDGNGITDRITDGDPVVTETINDPGQNIRAEVTVSNSAGEDTENDFYTVEQDQRAPEAELDVRPGVGDSGDTFTFDASNSKRGQTFKFDFNGDGIIEETTSSDRVTEVIADTGRFDAEVTVSNTAGDRSASDSYTVNEQPEPIADITVLSPVEGESVTRPVKAEIQLSRDESRYECFYDDDTINVVGSGKDGNQDSGALSRSGDRFKASIPKSDVAEGGAQLFFACERDDGERTGTKSVLFTVEQEASAPQAKFSVSDSTPIAGQQVEFDASSSTDPDGDIVNYEYSFGDGSSSSGSQTTHTYDTPDTYTVQLMVEDSGGRTDTTTKDLDVQTSPSPSAKLSADKSSVEVGEVVSLDASSSTDSDGSIVQYDFDPDGDGTFEKKNAGPKLENTYASAGSFEAAVRVTDNQGKTSTATTTISVGAPPKAQISADSTDVATGQTVEFDASGSSDPDGSVQTTKFDLNGDGTFEAEGPTAQRQFSSAGTFEITVRATDNSGLTDTASVDVSVGSAPSADFSFSPQSPQRGSDINFQSTATDPNNNIESKNWRVETPSGNEFNFNTGNTAVYTPQNTGVYLFTHSVTDSDGLSDTTAKQLEVGEDDTQQCGVDEGSVSGLELDPEEVEEGEESDVSVEVDNDGADQDVEIEFVSFDFSTGEFETIDTVEREVEENEEERFETEVEVDADSRITAEVLTEGDECGDRFITSTSERLGFSGQQEEDGVVRVSTSTNPGTGVNAFVTLIGPEDRAVKVGDNGERSLTVEPGNYKATARFSDNVRSRSIDVESGEVRPILFTFPSETTIQTETATGLTARLDSKEVDAGQRVRVKGDIRGTSGSQTVQLYSEGDKVSSTSSARDGSYTISFTPNRIGELSLSIRATGESAERSVQVLPTSSVLSVDAPQQVFEGDQFQICGRIETQEQAEVSLLRNGEDLKSKSGSGETCFDTTALDIGENKYTVRSSTYGNGNQKSTTVEVLEDQAEASISTDQVATVETESGTIRISIYNDNNEKQTYEADLIGVPDTWVESTTQEFVLQPGEEEEIYFYTTPREEGDFKPRIRVTEGGRTVLNKDVSIEVGGRKTQEQVSDSGLIEFILSGLNPA